MVTLNVRAPILFQFDTTTEDCLQELNCFELNFEIMQPHKDTKRTQLEERVNVDFFFLTFALNLQFMLLLLIPLME